MYMRITHVTLYVYPSLGVRQPMTSWLSFLPHPVDEDYEQRLCKVLEEELLSVSNRIYGEWPASNIYDKIILV